MGFSMFAGLNFRVGDLRTAETQRGPGPHGVSASKRHFGTPKSPAARGNGRLTENAAGKDACPTWNANHWRTTVAQASLPAHYCHGLLAFLALVCIFSFSASANPINPPLAFTGGYSEPSCTQCHTGTVNPPGGSVSILGVPAVYQPGVTIPLQVQIADAAGASWGFELSARFANGSQAGSFTPSGTVSVAIATWDAFPVQYARPGAAAVQAGPKFFFNVNWTTPPDLSGGEVVFDAAGVAANNDRQASGDHTYTTEVRSAPGSPQVNIGGIVSAASYQSAFSPGQLISIFGTNLTTGGPYLATTFPLPITLGPTDVRLNGLACPLLYVSNTQINAQIPFSNFIPGSSLTLTVALNALTSLASPITIADTAPAIFTISQTGAGSGTGSGPGAILHADYTPVSTSHPATAGEIVLIYATGLGQTLPATTEGLAATSGVVAAPVYVTMGGAMANISYAGVAPTYAGLYQVNTTVPVTNPPLSGNVEVLLTAGAVTSRSGVTITVQ
jgi:uncharacterized protein (TIGR03437 family)